MGLPHYAASRLGRDSKSNVLNTVPTLSKVPDDLMVVIVMMIKVLLLLHAGLKEFDGRFILSEIFETLQPRTLVLMSLMLTN